MTENSADILQQLRGIHLPPEPPEPALWPVLVAVIIIIATALVFLLNRKQQHHWHQQALQELKRIELLQEDRQLVEVAKLLKRVAITHHTTRDTTKLTGRRWLDYLDQFFNTNYFSKGEGRLFGDELYSKPSADEIPPEQVIGKVRQLIKYRVWFGVRV